MPIEEEARKYVRPSTTTATISYHRPLRVDFERLSTFRASTAFVARQVIATLPAVPRWRASVLMPEDDGGDEDEQEGFPQRDVPFNSLAKSGLVGVTFEAVPGDP